MNHFESFFFLFQPLKCLFLLCNIELNFFWLWTKQYISECHLELSDVLVDQTANRLIKKITQQINRQ